MANELDDRAHKHTHTLAARGLKKNYRFPSGRQGRRSLR